MNSSNVPLVVNAFLRNCNTSEWGPALPASGKAALLLQGVERWPLVSLCVSPGCAWPPDCELNYSFEATSVCKQESKPTQSLVCLSAPLPRPPVALQSSETIQGRSRRTQGGVVIYRISPWQLRIIKWGEDERARELNLRSPRCLSPRSSLYWVSWPGSSGPLLTATAHAPRCNVLPTGGSCTWERGQQACVRGGEEKEKRVTAPFSLSRGGQSWCVT